MIKEWGGALSKGYANEVTEVSSSSLLAASGVRIDEPVTWAVAELVDWGEGDLNLKIKTKFSSGALMRKRI
jgi:hypothetical protein